ncbi:MAG TPA: hypothetical protein VHV31_13630 [Nitrolancea sp.]|nr:hypothetical protein [Nitrolancea sp.]
MLEQRPYTPNELLTWCRLLCLSLAGAAMVYTREREGTIDGLVAYMSERIPGIGLGAGFGSVEAAMLGLLLNVEAIGGRIESRAVNPEGAELVTASLPGERLMTDLEDRFEVALSEEDLLQGLGVSRRDLDQLLDVFGRAAATTDFEYSREEEGDAQRLSLRVW